jgi:hypothetical protein
MAEEWAKWLRSASTWEKAEAPWAEGDVAAVWSKHEAFWWWIYPTPSEKGRSLSGKAVEATWSKVEGLWGEALAAAWDKSETVWWDLFPSAAAAERAPFKS